MSLNAHRLALLRLQQRACRNRIAGRLMLPSRNIEASPMPDIHMLVFAALAPHASKRNRGFRKECRHSSPLESRHRKARESRVTLAQAAALTPAAGRLPGSFSLSASPIE
jgi:hypothetical protein